MLSSNSAATIGVAGVVATSMLIVAYGSVQNGMAAEQADLIPAAQLVNAAIGSTATVTAMIAGHLDMVTGAYYSAAPDTTLLRLDGLILPWLK